MAETLEEVFQRLPVLRDVVATVCSSGFGKTINLDDLVAMAPELFTMSPYRWFTEVYPGHLPGHARRVWEEIVFVDQSGAVRFLGWSCPALNGPQLREIPGGQWE